MVHPEMRWNPGDSYKQKCNVGNELFPFKMAVIVFRVFMYDGQIIWDPFPFLPAFWLVFRLGVALIEGNIYLL
jgi:hypothetical protein